MLIGLRDVSAEHSILIALELVGVLIVFALEPAPLVIITVLGGLPMVSLVFLTVDEALADFANPIPITIAAMFILSGVLLRIGALEEISGWVIRCRLREPRLTITEIGGGTMTASALVNHCPVVIVMIPII